MDECGVRGFCLGSLFAFIPKQHACCGFSLTKEVWRGGETYGRPEISGIGYNTRGRVRGTGYRRFLAVSLSSKSQQ